MKIKLGKSDWFVNKDNHAPERPRKDTGEITNAYANAEFQVVEWSPSEITGHILAGKAITIAECKNNWRTGKNFVSCQLLGLDFDTDMAVTKLSEDPFIQSNAFLIYATPSSTSEHPRSRVLFMLDKPVTDTEVVRKYIKRLLQRFKTANADEKCKDPVRYFYGSKGAAHWSGGNVLPVTILESLPIHPDEIPRTESPAPKVHSQGDFGPYVAKVIENIVASVRSAPNGERNDTLNLAALRMGNLVAADWSQVTRLQGESLLLAAAPVSSTFPESEVRATINSGITAGLSEPMPAPNGHHSSNGDKSSVDPIAAAVQTAAAPPSDVDRVALALDKLVAIRKNEARRPDDMDEAIGRLDKELEILRAKTAKPVRVASSVVGNRVFAAIEENQKHPQPVQGLRSNIPLLDERIGGFRKDRVHVMLGDTNMGKSTFAAQLAAQWFQQTTILVVCTECPIDAFYIKMLASVANIPADRISDGLLSKDDLARLKTWQRKFDALVFDFLEGSSPTLSQLWQAVFDANDGHDSTFGGVVIDSISNVKAPGSNGEYDEVTMISDAIQEIALKAHLPIFATSQVGRSLKDRANKIPRKNDGRGSGAIEENCDVLMAAYVHDHYVRRNEAQPDPRIPANMGLIPILKHRWKESGGDAVPVEFIGGVKFGIWNSKTVNANQELEKRVLDL